MQQCSSAAVYSSVNLSALAAVAGTSFESHDGKWERGHSFSCVATRLVRYLPIPVAPRLSYPPPPPPPHHKHMLEPGCANTSMCGRSNTGILIVRHELSFFLLVLDRNKLVGRGISSAYYQNFWCHFFSYGARSFREGGMGGAR